MLPVLFDPDVRAVRLRFLAALEGMAPGLTEAGSRVLQRITAPTWALEWGLPRWLADAYGLSAEAAQELVLANVYGLACVRLQDDLADGEVAGVAQAQMLWLAAALHHLWLRAYVPLFDRTSPFWGYLDQYAGQWLRATLQSNEPPVTDFRAFSEADILRLGERGALLKVCCAGVCLLGGREALLPPLTSAVDSLLAGAVLLDHAQDWADDLAAGRYNAFVAYASSLPQVPGRLEDNRQKVLEEIYLGDAARAYFDVTGAQFRRAREIAAAADCLQLTEHLRWLEGQVTDFGARLAEEARTRLRSAVQEFWLLPAANDQTPNE